ncbi:MAG: hypothetical protein IH623_18675 [Verrucomicrobia bacterium]|nr:hypothetical protein [Verrucomicrobiota bacterium]
MNTSTPDSPVAAPAHQYSEGKTATAIERQTAKVPSDVFLWSAGASIAASLTLKMMGRKHEALFVGQWAPTFLLLGIYNKLVKLFGTDQRH